MRTDFTPPSLPRWMWGLVLLAVAGSLWAGYAFEQMQARQLQADVEARLSAVARLKAQQLADWRTERLGNGEAFTASAAFAADVADWFETPSPDGAAKILARLKALEVFHQYRDARLVDTTGRVRLSLQGDLTPLDADDQAALAGALQATQPIFHDFHFSAAKGSITLDVIAPLMGPDSRPLGAVMLSIDPQQYLYPLIETWPVPSLSAESLLVRREGNEVVWLNNLRYQRNAALTLRMPLSQQNVPAVMAVLGKTGVYPGADYRGVAVYSALQPVPNSPWFLVAKEDSDEALAFLRTVTGLIGVGLAGFLAAIGVAAGLVWQQVQKRYYRGIYAAEAQRLALARHFEYLVKYANDIIVLADADFNLVEVNDRALTTYGYSREEMLKLKLADLIAPEDLAHHRERMEELLTQGTFRREAWHRRCDGSTFPVEVSAQAMDIEGRPYYQGIFRDITERKQAERLIQEKNELLQAQNEELTAQREELQIQNEELSAQREELQTQNEELLAQQDELQEAERSLRESEARFRALFEGMTEGVGLHQVIYDAQGQAVNYQILAVNPQYETALNLRREAVVNKLATDAYGTAEPPYLAEYSRAAATGEPDHFETYFPPLNKYFYISVAPLGTGRFATIFFDITARKQAEEELAQVRLLLEQAFEQSPIPMALVSLPDAVIRIVNPACQTFLGIADEPSRVGLPLLDFHPTYKDYDAKGRLGEVADLPLARTFAGQRTLDEERIIERKDGTRRWELVTATPIYNHHGEIIAGYLILNDITDRKEAELLVQAQQEQLVAQNEELVAQNEELVSQGRALAEAEVQLQQSNEALEHRIQERSAELRAANADLQLANAALLRAGRMKDEFLANMSHELRTPLTGILGLAEVMEKGIYGDLTDKEHRALQMIHSSGEHLLQLINDILDLSKVEAGKVELELGPVEVEALCQASLEFVQQIAHKKKLTLSFSHDGQVRQVEADGRRLKQMLVNLLSNAVKFTPEGGQIGLEVEGDAGCQQVRFTVWDTGIGIPPEKQSLLFQPFVQLDGSLSRRYEGTGLGLALVHSLAELHGGRVAVESPGLGLGARFTITLPWTPEPPPSSPAADDTALVLAQPLSLKTRLGRAPVILAADDNPTTLNVLSDLLEAADCRVITTTNGEETLAQVEAAHPDLVLLDIQMPDIDGLAVVRRLRARGSTVPVIALTALAMPGDRERCLEAGASDYMTKPVNLANLVQAMAHQLGISVPGLA